MCREDVEGVRDQLDSLASGLAVMQQSAGLSLERCRAFRTRLVETWGGPIPERICGRILDYVDAIDEITSVLSTATFTVTSWYNHAVWKTERLRTLEAAVVSAQSEVDNGSFDTTEAEDEAYTTLGNAISLHIESAQNWLNRCKTFADDLAGEITTLKRLNKITAFAEGESIPPTGRAFEAALTDIANDLGVSAYAEQPVDVENIDGVDAAGFFIAWLLDPYHDTVVAAIAVEGGASPGLGCKLDNGTFPDLCRPGSVPFQIGEVKYNTAASVAAGVQQLLTYTQSAKDGSLVTAGSFLMGGIGYRVVTVGGVTIQYGQAHDADGQPIDGLYTYQIVGWSVPALLESHAQARAHTYVEMPAPSEIPYDMHDPAGTLAATAQTGSSADGGWNPPAIPRIEVSPEAAATVGVLGAILLAGVLLVAV